MYRLDGADLTRTLRLYVGAGEGIRTPDLLITNQLLYRTELRQPGKLVILAHVKRINRLTHEKHRRASPTDAVKGNQPTLVTPGHSGPGPSIVSWPIDSQRIVGSKT